MSGPIVRTGTTPKFWKNWGNIFGDQAAEGTGESKPKAAKKTAEKKPAEKPAAKKTAKKKK